MQLGHATARYLDALHVAAEHLAVPRTIANLDGEAHQLINALANEAAWPASRGRLLLTADDTDPSPACATQRSYGNPTAQLIMRPSPTGDSTRPTFATQRRRCRG
jgi:hypothetical protein